MSDLNALFALALTSRGWWGLRPLPRRVAQSSSLMFTLGSTLIFALVSIGCGSHKVDQDVERAQYHYQLAYGHFSENHNSDAAQQEIIRSVKYNDKNPEAHLLAGLIYSGRGELLKSIEHYQMALKLKPDFYKAKNNLGTIYLALGNWIKAVEVFSDLITHDEYTTPAIGFNNLGWAQYKLGRDDEALRSFITASQLNPRLCPPHNNVAILYLKRDDLERAERSLSRGLRQCPQYAEPHLHLGRLYAQRGEVARAAESWAKCHELSSDNDLGLRCARLLRELHSGAPRAQ